MNYENFIEYSKEVLDAKKNHKAIVALESTIITHGMPYPKNIETAKEVEDIVRAQGAVPATIAIMDGIIKIGLSDAELDKLGQAKDVIKSSRRDLDYVIANKKNGGTTVALTMILSKMAGVKVFVTGGVGGVHRGAEQTMDISADLQELGKTDVMVVSAGAKSILDLPKTLEYLETQGVCVYGFKTKELPAFFTSKSGLELDYKIDSYEEMANILFTHEQLHLDNGLLLCNPIKKEDEMNKEVIDKAIDEAVAEMNKKGIKGKKQTPFLLAKIVEITGGESLESNRKLVFNNAVVGANIARIYQEKVNNAK